LDRFCPTHPVRLAGQTEIKTMNLTNLTLTDAQLELSLDATLRPPRVTRRERRTARAAWWFGKMRAAVNQAMDWPPTNAPRPEQTFLPGAYRQVRV
jgi:hypothetical protein